MQIIFYRFHIILIILLPECIAQVVKPSFFPYCMTRYRCKPDCACEVLPDCKLENIDDNFRKGVLFHLNKIRNTESAAEPQAAGMTKLEYDTELEEISKCWAARCEFEYSECFVTPRYSETSQLVIQVPLETGQQPNILLVLEELKELLNGVETLSAETIKSLPSGEAGESLHNYALLMSDRLLTVGCAWSLLQSTVTFVCTYGPRGPLQGEPIYKTGYVCSLCPTDYACDFQKPEKNLCKSRSHKHLPEVTTVGAYGTNSYAPGAYGTSPGVSYAPGTDGTNPPNPYPPGTYGTNPPNPYPPGPYGTYPPNPYPPGIYETNPPASYAPGTYGTNPPNPYSPGTYGTNPPNPYPPGTYGTNPPNPYPPGTYGTNPPNPYPPGVYETNPPASYVPQGTTFQPYFTPPRPPPLPSMPSDIPDDYSNNQIDIPLPPPLPILPDYPSVEQKPLVPPAPLLPQETVPPLPVLPQQTFLPPLPPLPTSLNGCETSSSTGGTNVTSTTDETPLKRSGNVSSESLQHIGLSLMILSAVALFLF